jgi:DNA-binding PadR family transcriptional regulator
MKEKPSGDAVRANLDLMVLSVLAEQTCYGYLIQQRVARASGGMVSLQAGTLYPLLHRLEADRLIRSQWDSSTGRRRKWYSLTAAGRRQLQRQAHQWQKYAQCLEALLAPVLKGEPGVG